MFTHKTKPKLAYSINEACDATSLGRSTIYSLIKNQRLKVVSVGSRRVIPEGSLRSFLSGKIQEANSSIEEDVR